MAHLAPRSESRQTVNGVCCAAPILLSIMALTLVVQGLVQFGGAIPADEGIHAHIFQILMAVQVPLIALYAATADWSARTKTLRTLGLQLGGWIAAVGAVVAWQFTAAA